MKKKPYAVVGALFILCIISNSVKYAAATTSETAVIGNIAPTMIKVSAPAKVVFSIDPNIGEPDKRFTSSSIRIINESNAAVKVKISSGKENFSLTNDSLWKPTNTLPDQFYWRDIGTQESESYIALGIKTDVGNWRKVIRADTLYVSEQNKAGTDIEFGEVQRNADAYMKLVCYHGSSFSESKECSYRIIWSFSIGD